MIGGETSRMRVARRFEGGLVFSGARRSSARAAARASIASTARVLLHDALELRRGGHAHADEILFVAAGGDRAGGGGVREHAVLGDEAGGGHLRHHESGFQAGVSGEEGGQVLVERRVDEAVDAALGDAGEGGERDREEVELKGERLAVEVAAGEDLAVEDQRVVGGGVQLDGEDAARFGERVANGAVDLRRATQRVGVLHAAAGDVRLADLAAFEQVAEAARALELAGMRAGRVDTVVKGARSAAQRVERHRADDVGGVGEGLARRRVRGSRWRASPACR